MKGTVMYYYDLTAEGRRENKSAVTESLALDLTELKYSCRGCTSISHILRALAEPRIKGVSIALLVSGGIHT